MTNAPFSKDTMNASVSTCCPWCRGSGRLPLTGVYLATLELLRRQSGEVSGADLARQDGCKGPAMNNRLARLEQLGLAVSRRDGRKRLYLMPTDAKPDGLPAFEEAPCATP